MKVTKYHVDIKNGNRNHFATATWPFRPIVTFFIVMTSSAYATVTFGCKNGFFS